MRRLWLVLTAFTAGLWVLLWRTRLREQSTSSPETDKRITTKTPSAPSGEEIEKVAQSVSVPLTPLLSDGETKRKSKQWVSTAQNIGLAAFGVGLGVMVVWVGARVFLTPEVAPSAQVESPAVAVGGCESEPGDWVFALQAAGIPLQACADYYWEDLPFGEFYYNVQLNNFGFHDTPFTLEKPEDVYRILIIGDSFPRGEEVPMTSGFPYLLERQLGISSEPSLPRVEIINLSVPALGTDRELLLYAGFGWRFQADVVLLCMYTGNDIRDNDIDLEHLQYGYRLNRPFFTLESGILTLHRSEGVALDARRFPDAPAWQWLMNMRERQTPAPPENLPTRPLVIDRDPYQTEYPVDLGLYMQEDEYWTRAWTLTETLVLQLRDLVEAQGSRFGVVIIPDRRAVHAEDWAFTLQLFPIAGAGNPLSPIARLVLFMQQNGIIALNLTTALREHVAEFPGRRVYYPSDGHLNLDGHVVVAEALRQWLLEQALLPVQ